MDAGVLLRPFRGAFVSGSWLTPPALVAAGQFGGIARIARRATALGV